ncbi:MAG: ABC transporter substrate-binding protein [Burkholderiales bacterium]|nr:ABC transporter substrate-binding protein [Burkholderiales bacterium]
MARLVAALVAWVTLLAAAGGHAQESPEALVKRAADEVLALIKETKDQTKLVAAAESRIVPYFDFTRMTRLAAGRNWNQASPAQRAALEKAFRTLLVRTYTVALSRTSGEAKVDVRPAVAGPDPGEVVVKTVATEPGRQPIPIDYRMAKAADGWKVYDVTVENLSLVTTYRGSFQSEIARTGIDGLIKVIEERNRKAAEG